MIIAFDGDGVLFDLESQEICDNHGLESFTDHEIRKKNVLMKPGPAWQLMLKFMKLRTICNDLKMIFITARGLHQGERVLKTFEAMDLEFDVTIFTNGDPKGPYLKAAKVDLFFDDKLKHVIDAIEHDIFTVHVLQNAEKNAKIKYAIDNMGILK